MIDPVAQRRIEELSAALAKLDPYVGTVWRASTLSRSRAHEYRVGDVVAEPAFVSATRDPLRHVPGQTTYAIASREGKDVSAFSAFPQDAEVVIDRAATFLVMAVDDAGDGEQCTVFLAELPRELTPTDMSALGAASKQLLTRMRAEQDQRSTVPAGQRHPLNTPEKYTFPVGMDDDGRLRRITQGSGATG